MQVGLRNPAVGDYVSGWDALPLRALAGGPVQAAGARIQDAQAAPLLYGDVSCGVVVVLWGVVLLCGVIV